MRSGQYRRTYRSRLANVLQGYISDEELTGQFASGAFVIRVDIWMC